MWIISLCTGALCSVQPVSNIIFTFQVRSVNFSHNVKVDIFCISDVDNEVYIVRKKNLSSEKVGNRKNKFYAAPRFSLRHSETYFVLLLAFSISLHCYRFIFLCKSNLSGRLHSKQKKLQLGQNTNLKNVILQWVKIQLWANFKHIFHFEIFSPHDSDTSFDWLHSILFHIYRDSFFCKKNLPAVSSRLSIK